MLYLCLQIAENEGAKDEFMETWVNSPRLMYAWMLLKTFDPRHQKVIRESHYNPVRHGMEGRKRILDKNGERRYI